MPCAGWGVSGTLSPLLLGSLQLTAHMRRQRRAGEPEQRRFGPTFAQGGNV